MKPSVDAIINELALRALESQDHDLFMRRVANALNGYPRESLFFGRIISYSLKGEQFVPDMFEAARKNIYDEHKRCSANMTEYSLELTENATAIYVRFKYEATDETGKPCTGNTYLTIHQDSDIIDAFDITVD